MSAANTPAKGSFKSILYNCFVAPFRARERAHIYVGSMLGAIGFALYEVYLCFDIAGQGMAALLSFLIARYSLGCFVCMPAGFLALARFGARRTFACAMMLQVLGASYMLLNLGTALVPWMYGLLGAMTTAPFWIAYHTALTLNTSAENRGNEVVLADAGRTLGAMAGSILGGIALAMEFPLGSGPVIFALVLVACGTFILARRLMGTDVHIDYGNGTILGALVQQPARTVLTVFDGAIYNLTFMLAPVWLKIMGLGGMAVGIINALSVVLNVIMAPFAGAMMNRRDGREVTIGSALWFAGWAPWAVLSSPLLLAGTYLFWSTAAQLTGNGLTCKWYEVRCVKALAAREILIGVARVVSTITVVPILYLSFTHFAWAAILTGALMTATAIAVRRVRAAALLAQ